MRELLFASFAVCLAVSMFVSSASATTYTVRKDAMGDFTTIQAAMNAAWSGDTIIVFPGIYSEAIFYNQKDIILQSTNPYSYATVSATIIDGNDIRCNVTFGGNETALSALRGFTIRNGRALVRTTYYYYGGGIYGNGCKTLIEHNILSNNSAYIGNSDSRLILGGAIFDCDGIIRNNVFDKNSAISGYDSLVTIHQMAAVEH